MNTLLKFALAASLLTVVGCNKNTNGDATNAHNAEMAPEDSSADSAPEEAPEAGDAAKQHTDAALIGKEWPLTHLNDEALTSDNGVTISFDEDGKIAGSAGCNRYMGDYDITGEGELEITLGGSTMMMCGEDSMAVEEQIHALLPTISEYSIDEESGALTLHTADGQKLSGE